MKEYGTEKYLGQPFGNCLQPTPGTDFVTAVDQGLTYSYSRPEITAITPTRGVNMANSSFDITIYGTNMGGTARELQRDKCLLPAYANLRACKLLMTNGVIIFNTSCQDIDLLTNASAPAQIEQEIAARQLAACRDSKQITFKCQHAFTAKYTMCVERCRFAFRKCGRRCAEDALSCQVLPFGGNQVLTIVLGGTTSGSFNLTYEVPRVWYIIPPELSASLLRPASSLAVQEPKLLTIIGRNFGVDLALAYAGRRQIAPIGPYDWNLPNLLYDNTQIPLYAPSIEWWDMAQYRTCFSVVPDATEGDAAASASTPVSSHTRQCDAGVVLSEMTNLADVERSFLGEDSPRYLQRMIVKAPVVALSSDEVSIEINALVESLGQRSYAMPAVNSTILFRQSCSDFAPHMGRHTLPFFQATKKLRGIVSRSEVQVVSWAAKEAIVMIGGSTLDQLHTRKIFVSGFSGLNAWVEIQYNDAVPWFSARSNQTVVIYKDVLAVIAGWSTGPVPPGSQVATKIFYNDVWIYADSEGVANIYKSDKSPEPQLALGQDFVPYWILVALNAPFRPRSSMTAVEFKGRLFLMGGDGPDSLGVIAPIADLWVTNDLKVWTILQDLTSWDLTTPLWQGRNSLFALVHDEKLYVVARVQNSFYNTFYSENGNDWLPVPGACALSHIEVQAAVVYRSRMLLFTVGCHSYDIPAGARRYEKAIDCSVEQDGPFQRENRIYYSSDGVTWRLSQRPFRLSQFLEPEFMQHHWSGKRSGEYRVGYKVLVHHDSLYLIGGQQKITFVDKFDNPILDKDGKVQKQDLDAMDMWLSKGLVDLLLLCVQNSDLTTQGIIDAMQAATSPECEFGFSKLPGGVLQDAILPR